MATVPLNLIPSNFRAWNAYSGIDLLWLDETTRDFNDNDDCGFEVIGTFGVSMEY